MKNNFINRVVFLIHDLLSYLFEEKTKGNTLVKWLTSQKLSFKVYYFIEDMAVLTSTHLCQFFYLEDVQQVLEGEKLELFSEILS
jgi:hypothetical protein